VRWTLWALGVVSRWRDGCAMGSRGWVQHLPVLTQGLQNPHSPSLQRSHFQRQVLAKAEQVLQKKPDWRRVAGSDVVLA